MPSMLATGAGIGHAQVEALLARLAPLRAVSQDALEAATAIGTTTRELSTAQQAWATAEQAWQEAYQAFEVGQYQESWEKLQIAEVAFKTAEEHAVHAGVDHIERELAQEYAHRFPVDALGSDVRPHSVQPIEGGVNLRNDAGPHAQIVGKAQPGQRLQILAEVGEWYRVRTEQGIVGWVSKNWVVHVY